MKAFWAIVFALLVAGAALFVLGKPSGGAGPIAPVAQPEHAAQALDRFDAQPTPQPQVQPPTPTAVQAAEPVATPPSSRSFAESNAAQPKLAQTVTAQSSSAPTSSAQTNPGATDPAKPATASTHAQGHTPATTTPAPPTGGGKASTLADFEVEPGDIKPQPDGTTLIDGRFTLKGDGSEANPFRVPWEMLVSVNEVFDPSKKLNKIPQRIAMLENKHVRLTGYVAFPLMVQRPRELLSMLNQWDGCCIGVPPTPYDAVEVKLKKAVGNKERFANAGMVQGIFRTEPYVVKNWVVGMYVLSDATFTPVDAGEDPAGEAAPLQ
jgi:hypothetical protein